MPVILALEKEAEGPQTGSHPGLHRHVLSLKSGRKNEKKKLSALENANSLLVYQRKIIIRKEARTHAIIWMKFEDIVLSDISH